MSPAPACLPLQILLSAIHQPGISNLTQELGKSRKKKKQKTQKQLHLYCQLPNLLPEKGRTNSLRPPFCWYVLLAGMARCMAGSSDPVSTLTCCQAWISPAFGLLRTSGYPSYGQWLRTCRSSEKAVLTSAKL